MQKPEALIATTTKLPLGVTGVQPHLLSMTNH